MIQGITKKGELKNVIVNDDGTLQVKFDGEISQMSDREITLISNILNLSTEAQIISVGKKVTMIMIANYSETADVSIVAGNKTYQVGANLALELPVNTIIENFLLSSTESNTKIQFVVKGVE